MNKYRLSGHHAFVSKSSFLSSSWSNDFTDHHPGPLPPLRLTPSCHRWSVPHSALHRFPSSLKSVHEALHCVKLSGQFGQTVFHGIELLVEVAESVRQVLDPESNKVKQSPQYSYYRDKHQP